MENHHQYNLIGKKLGTCTLEKSIGQGGMGEVYLARQERPERNVAVKVLYTHGQIDSQTHGQFLARFQREANIIARLEHVNIMPIYEYGEQDGLAYLVMPHLTGGSLRDLLAQRGPFAPLEALQYIEQATSALDYAHAHGIVHRDLKPANFLLHTDGRLMLADFGIARMVEGNETLPTSSMLTGTGILVGTPEYMAPEMARGEQIDHRTDIYELGIVLYQMLSGVVPFKGNTPLVVAAMHLHQTLPSLCAKNPAIPATVDDVLAKATAKNPEQRFASAGAMAQALREALTTTFLQPAPSSAQDEKKPYAQNWYEHIRPEQPHNPILVSTTSIPPTLTPIPYIVQPPSMYPPPIDRPMTPLLPSVMLAQQPKQQNWQPWFVFLGLLLVILLITSGVLIGLQLNHGTITNQETQPTGQPTPATTAQAIPTINPTVAPTTLQNTLVKGQILFSTNEPGANKAGAPCDEGSAHWANYNSPDITCQTGNVRLYNPQRTLAGTILETLSGNVAYTSDYIVEATLQAAPSSQADFGIYFRSQPGNAQGVYTFIIHPDGSWGTHIYDNTTGASTQIVSGNAHTSARASLTLDVVANGPAYTFYINGQQVGQTSNTMYLNGTVGIVVGTGGTITVSNFALYAVSV